jgi:hypothetical protein
MRVRLITKLSVVVLGQGMRKIGWSAGWDQGAPML